MPDQNQPQLSRAERRAKKAGKTPPPLNPERGRSTFAGRGKPAAQGKQYAFRRS
jgi:hypothetical protein